MRPDDTIAHPRHSVVVGLVAIRFASIIGTAWFALRAPSFHLVSQPNDRDDAANPTADALSPLPTSYGDVPKLGPPLPGDLGRPFSIINGRWRYKLARATTPRRVPDLPVQSPRERVVVPSPCSCPACGGVRLSKLGEDITETLEVIPRQWKLIQIVREKFACRDCEKISQPPTPFHVVPRGWAGSSFLAMLLFEKYGQHQRLNRQADRFAREGVLLSVATLADQAGAATFALMPIYKRIVPHVLAATRLHGDDTTVPVMAKGKTFTARLWTYVRDYRQFAGPAALFHYSRDRRGEHPRAHLATWSGLMQADAYGGYNELYAPGRQPGAVLACIADHPTSRLDELLPWNWRSRQVALAA